MEGMSGRQATMVSIQVGDLSNRFCASVRVRVAEQQAELIWQG